MIPADMRSAMLIDDTGCLTARVVDGELRVLAPDAALFKLQEYDAREGARGRVRGR